MSCSGDAGRGSSRGTMVALASLPQRLVVTGPSGAGKTTFCRQVLASAQTAGWQAAGLLSLPRFEARHKTGIVALDLSSGEKRLLASCRPDEISGLSFGQWTFDTHTLAWGNDVLERVPPCDLVIVDEIGPLEFDLHQGWTAGLQVLLRHADGLVLATIRPAYLARLQAFWPNSAILTVETAALYTTCLTSGYSASQTPLSRR